MASKDSLDIREKLARGEVGQVVANTPVAIRLRYIGSGSVTSVTIDVSTDIEMVTTDGGTDTYLFSTYTTIGTLIDAINADGIFEAKVLDALRTYATDDQFVDGAITSMPLLDGGGLSTTVWDVKVDTSAALYIAYRLTYDRGFLRKQSQRQHRVHLQEIEYYADLTAANDSLQVHECDGTIEYKKFGKLSVDTTDTTINFSDGSGKLTAREGDDLVIVLKTAGALSDTSLSLLITGIVE